MIRKFLAGVANVDVFVGDQYVLSAKTLMDSSLTIGTTAEDVRGGQGNQLFGKYYHTSTFDLTLTDVMFNLEYLAFQTGSTIEQGTSMFENEQITITDNKGQIAGVPMDIDNYGVIGWASIMGDESYQKVTFTENAGKYEFEFNAPNGTIVCVKYMSQNMNARSIKISANMIPDEVKLVMTANEFKAGTSGDMTSSSRAGVLEIIVPRFQFSGNMELAMTASGVSNSPLEGSALAVTDPDCNANAGYYAIINEVVYGEDAMTDIFSLAVDGGNDVELAAGESTTLIVYAIKKVGSPFIIDNSLLTFTSAAAGTATAGTNTGVITGVAEGETTVSVALTSNPSVDTVVNVSVSGGSTVEPLTVSVPSISMLGKEASDLETGLTFTQDGTIDTQINASGELRKVTGWTEFSSNPSEQNGYYLPFTVPGSKEDYEGFTGTSGTIVPFDDDMTAVVFMGESGEKKTITIKKVDGTSYSINTSAITFEA